MQYAHMQPLTASCGGLVSRPVASCEVHQVLHVTGCDVLQYCMVSVVSWNNNSRGAPLFSILGETLNTDVWKDAGSHLDSFT